MRENGADFERLLAAHANGELDEREERRLRDLAGRDPARADLVKEIEEVRDLLGEERRLFEEVSACPDPGEEADTTYRSLARAAARSEGTIRAALGGLDQITSVRRRRWLPATLLAAALVIVFGAILSSRPGGPPPLDHRPPADLRAGGEGARILFSPRVSADARRLSWRAVPGARTYDACIEDTEGRVVLRRPEPRARSTSWEFTEEEYRKLKSMPGPLQVRVVARDGVGLALATSGDLELDVR